MMARIYSSIAGVALAAVALLPLSAVAADSLEARVDRLERQLDSQALVDMSTRLDRLQQDVQQLRGQVELQGHMIDELKQRQRDLYLDIDRRLSQLERVGGGAAAPSAAPAPAAAPAASTVPAAAPASVAPASASAADADKEREAYQKAFDLLRDLRYEQAIAAFRGFLKQYPDGRYGHIAQYWVSEANYAQRNFKQAIADYQQLIDHYPKSPKLAEAMLKIGYSYYEMGQKDAARKELTELTQRYPDTTEAGQASTFLQKMRQEEKKG